MAGLHGDETVGTYTVVELARYFYDNYNEFSQILNHRMIIILPFVNPVGYYNKAREEFHGPNASFDANRDFPYDKESCFNTAASRFVDQIFRSHLIVSAFTFHGGETSLSYPWGNFPHGKRESPDYKAFSEVAQFLQKRVGENKAHPDWAVKPYKTGDMASVKYPVKGGFEDWAYGGSWDNKNMKKCNPSQTSPMYSLREKDYDKYALRSFVYSVNTSDVKSPPIKTLGTVNDVANPGDTDGFVSRNLRMSLDFIKQTMPYIIVKSIKYDKNENQISLKYKAGGCFSINQTNVLWQNTEQVKHSNYWSRTKPNSATLNNDIHDGNLKNPNSEIEAVFKLKRGSKDPISIKIILNCDRQWQDPPKGISDDPQSLQVMARTRKFAKKINNNGWFLNNYNQTKYYINHIIPEKMADLYYDFSEPRQLKFTDKNSIYVANNPNGTFSNMYFYLTNISENKFTIQLKLLKQEKLDLENVELFIRLKENGFKQTTKGLKLKKQTDFYICELDGYSIFQIIGKKLELWDVEKNTLIFQEIIRKKQNIDCLTKGIGCKGMVLTGNGEVLFNKDNKKLKLNIMRKGDTAVIISGKIHVDHYNNYIHNDQLTIKAFGYKIIFTLRKYTSEYVIFSKSLEQPYGMEDIVGTPVLVLFDDQKNDQAREAKPNNQLKYIYSFVGNKSTQLDPIDPKNDNTLFSKNGDNNGIVFAGASDIVEPDLIMSLTEAIVYAIFFACCVALVIFLYLHNRVRSLVKIRENNEPKQYIPDDFKSSPRERGGLSLNSSSRSMKSIATNNIKSNFFGMSNTKFDETLKNPKVSMGGSKKGIQPSINNMNVQQIKDPCEYDDGVEIKLTNIDVKSVETN